MESGISMIPMVEKKDCRCKNIAFDICYGYDISYDDICCEYNISHNDISVNTIFGKYSRDCSITAIRMILAYRRREWNNEWRDS